MYQNKYFLLIVFAYFKKFNNFNYRFSDLIETDKYFSLDMLIKPYLLIKPHFSTKYNFASLLYNNIDNVKNDNFHIFFSLSSISYNN